MRKLLLSILLLALIAFCLTSVVASQGSDLQQQVFKLEASMKQMHVSFDNLQEEVAMLRGEVKILRKELESKK